MCIHALGIEPDQVEPETPEEPEEEVENPFEGEEFDGEANVEIATSDFDDDGIRAIVAGFHTVSKDGEEESNSEIANIAVLATTGKTESDKKIANELVSSIKEQYETRGSGYKAPFRGPSAKQLKESQQQTWVSNSNSKPNITKPSEAVATNMKTMVVCAANAPKKPEDAADYQQLWAGLVNGITIPETFTCIFDILSRTANIQYYYRMAMGYAEHRRIIAANQGHLQRSAVLAILVNFVVLQQQSPRFIQIYSQALQREPNLSVNNWEQAHRIVTHPAYPCNDLGLTFEPPSSTSDPWVIRTAWHEDQLQTLVLGLRPSLDVLQNLLMFTNTFIRMCPASNPFEGARLEGQTPQTMYSAPFIMASPVEGALTPPSTPSVVSGPAEQNAPASMEDSPASMGKVAAGRIVITGGRGNIGESRMHR